MPTAADNRIRRKNIKWNVLAFLNVLVCYTSLHLLLYTQESQEAVCSAPRLTVLWGNRSCALRPRQKGEKKMPQNAQISRSRMHRMITFEIQICLNASVCYTIACKTRWLKIISLACADHSTHLPVYFHRTSVNKAFTFHFSNCTVSCHFDCQVPDKHSVLTADSSQSV